MTTIRRLQAAFFNERIDSLIEDGYVVQFKTMTAADNLWFATLRHRSNGNRILLKAYPLENSILQYTNKVITHKGQLLQSPKETY